MSVVVFEDEVVAQLNPLTIGRPAFAVTCGGYRLLDWLRRLAVSRGAEVHALVRPHLRDLQALDHPELAAPPHTAPQLLVNARMVPSAAVYRQLCELWTAGRPGVVREGEVIAAAVLPTGAPVPSSTGGDSASAYFAKLGLSGLEPLEAILPLLQWPHELIGWNLKLLAENLEHRLAHGEYQQTADGVFLGSGARLGPYAVCDTRGGPIVLETGADVGPYCFLRGPCLLDAGARVIEHSAIKDAVCLGHTTKIGGEVEASVIEPYTNKQHHGFLGHSYLGSWINLGAGTCNSDLKNTYGSVNMEYGTRRVPTGMQFVGCFVGDYAKTAINTGIFTGKVIGACSMVYGFVTTNVPSFVNYARLFGQVTEMPPEVMASAQQRMFARRGVTQRPADIQLLHAMFERTRDERRLAGEPLSL